MKCCVVVVRLREASLTVVVDRVAPLKDEPGAAEATRWDRAVPAQAAGLRGAAPGARDVNVLPQHRRRVVHPLVDDAPLRPLAVAVRQVRRARQH